MENVKMNLAELARQKKIKKPFEIKPKTLTKAQQIYQDFLELKKSFKVKLAVEVAKKGYDFIDFYINEDDLNFFNEYNDNWGAFIKHDTTLMKFYDWLIKEGFSLTINRHDSRGKEPLEFSKDYYFRISWKKIS